MAKQEQERASIKIANVRISFPSLFQTEVFGDDDTGKYAATFILDKVEHADAIKAIQGQFNTIAREKWKGKMLPADRLCLKDGDESDREGYEGTYTIKASTKKRPMVINRDKSVIVEEDDIIYAGCYVNCIFNLWAQDNQFGKRINATLLGVQFAANGEPFQTGGVDADEFDMFATEDELQF